MKGKCQQDIINDCKAEERALSSNVSLDVTDSLERRKSIDYVKGLHSDPNFWIACSKFPECEIAKARSYFPKDFGVPSENFRIDLVTLRFMHRICHYCKTSYSMMFDRKMRQCTNCYLVFYCDQQCQRNHYKKHRLWCKMLPNVSVPERNNPYEMDYAVFDTRDLSKPIREYGAPK